MTRKDYVRFADLIYTHRHTDGGHPNSTTISIMQEMVEIFQVDNPHFDADHFKDACGFAVFKGISGK